MYGIYAYIRVVSGVNVGIYSIHGVFGSKALLLLVAMASNLIAMASTVRSFLLLYMMFQVKKKFQRDERTLQKFL